MMCILGGYNTSSIAYKKQYVYIYNIYKHKLIIMHVDI